ncbi:MAG: GIY-YIG nuclease family protein [Nitrospinae bacterium]|nr:GIY-YIG nuclease family protein [Nitrospinota bacterium]
MKAAQCFWLYVLECDNGKFYTGYTRNLAVRYYRHKNGKQGAKYTRGFKPVRIAQCWRLFGSVGAALKVERFIKKQPRATKERWVKNPDVLPKIIADKLDPDLKLIPFDSRLVERESEKLDLKKVRSGFDPFAQTPPAEAGGGEIPRTRS